MEIILYSTGCPRCSMIEHKLETKGIEYIKNNNVDEMLALGINEVPVLSVNGELMNYKQIVNWLVSSKGEGE